MVESTMDSTSMIKKRGTGCTTGQMGNATKDNGKMENNTGKERSTTAKGNQEEVFGMMEIALSG